MLYTAWWYDNGTSATISQPVWRWDALRNGKEYALENVSANTKDELEEEIRYFQEKKALQLLMQNP